ncbi:DNA repair protein RecN, partial [Albidovulum sp.]|uniref:DNA repair protein RecN n=1 Tax=Albidovulum sp. TaxID=1872424 RepID=UPI0039B8F46A
AAAGRSLAEAAARIEAMRAEEDYLRHAVAELDRLSPLPGEEAELDARRRQMQAGARIREDVARAAQALGPDGAERLMADAMRWLDGAAARAEGLLDEALEALGRGLTELGEAAQGVEWALERLAHDPRELEAVEERLFAIRALARKHAVAADDLGGFAGEMRAKLGLIEGGAADLKTLEARRVAAEAAYGREAARVSEMRTKAAAALDRAIAGELAPLKLERARFATVVAPADPGPEGCDAVAFTVATNPGAAPGPLDRIASGGELSRFLLALKVCLAKGGEPVTMIFDEIDRGVGGATADAVGRRLERLAEGGQILVVTHSPQVAARGAHHWRVEKRLAKGAATSTVTALSPAERVDEIARMLAGENVTEAARAAARALLDG